MHLHLDRSKKTHKVNISFIYIYKFIHQKKTYAKLFSELLLQLFGSSDHSYVQSHEFVHEWLVFKTFEALVGLEISASTLRFSTVYICHVNF